MRGSFLCDVGRRVRGRQWPAVAQAFRPADERGAALKGCAARLATVCLAVLVMTSSAITAAATADLRLIEAVKNRDVESVRALLQERPARIDVNAAQGDGAPALHWAAHRDDLAIADLLIRAGARANVANDLGATPLHLACTNRSAAMVERLLAAGADARATLLNGETALMTCARAGDAGAVKALLAHGADVNAKEHEHQQTALMWAVAQRHPEVVELLIEARADTGARSLTYAQTVVGEQTQRAGREERNYTVLRGGATPLLFAARAGDEQSATLLLKAGADPNDSQPDGADAVMLAAGMGSSRTASRRGVETIDFGKVEPESRVRDAVAAAVDLGGDVNAASQTGDTAMHVAAALGHDTVVQFLAEHGAAVNMKNTRGITPLLAAMFGSTAGRGRAAAPAGADSLGFEPPIELAHPSTVALLKKLGAAE